MAEPTKQDLIATARREAAAAGIPETHIPVFLGLIEQESRWNPKARSPVGAMGLGQLMPGTARELGVKDPHDPVENLRGSAQYFSQQLNRFGGDAGMALAAYNWGPANAAKLQTKPGSVRVPKETQDYVPGVFERALAYGSQLAPTNFVASVFPKIANVARTAVDKMVGDRFAPSATKVEEAIKTGSTPNASTGATTGLPPGDAGAATGLLIDEGTERMLQGGVGLSAKAPARGQVAQRAVTMDDFLKESYGPLASVADPFPKSFDQELMRIIKDA